jgi:hypothetical protein
MQVKETSAQSISSPAAISDVAVGVSGGVLKATPVAC